MNGIIKKVLIDKAKEVPLKNLISSIKTVENEVKGNQQQNEVKGSNADYSDQKFMPQNKRPLISFKDIEQNRNSVAKDERFSYLNSKAIAYTHGWNTLNVSLCDTNKNVFMNPSTGDFHCLKCSKNGDWSSFKSLVDSIREKKECVHAKDSDLIKSLNSEIELNEIPCFSNWNFSKQIKALKESEFKILLKNSGINHAFDKALFELYDIRFDSQSRALFPVYDDNKKLIEIVHLDPLNEKNENLNKNFIYGQETLVKIEKLKLKELYITDKLVNLLTINQQLKQPAIVINSSTAIDFKLIALLESFDNIIFWQKDVKLSYSLAHLLNYTRCFLISYSRNPFECLSLQEPLAQIVKNEKFPIKNDFIIRFDSLKEAIYSEIVCAKKFNGVQWKRFSQLNEILKGHRTGELTIFTGPTGSGKTTFLSEYSLDLSMQGVKTLWGSFELQNHRLVKMMMTQYAGLNLAKNVQLFDFVSKKFSQLPMFFMNFHGQETLENVIKTMSNAVVTHDIKHVIIDNLQFMIGCQFSNAMDKFTQQDQIIGAFRRFATNFGCHVTIVIHPRKEDSDELLKVSSIFGTAKATQEADNIMILQQHKIVKNNKTSHLKYVQISKNRFDGELGNMVIRFDKETLSFQNVKSSSQQQESVDEAENL